MTCGTIVTFIIEKQNLLALRLQEMKRTLLHFLIINFFEKISTNFIIIIELKVVSKMPTDEIISIDFLN